MKKTEKKELDAEIEILNRGRRSPPAPELSLEEWLQERYDDCIRHASSKIGFDRLANEASGFLGMSDVQRHGQTNSRVLRLRIEEAHDAIAKAQGCQ